MIICLINLVISSLINDSIIQDSFLGNDVAQINAHNFTHKKTFKFNFISTKIIKWKFLKTVHFLFVDFLSYISIIRRKRSVGAGHANNITSHLYIGKLNCLKYIYLNISLLFLFFKSHFKNNCWNSNQSINN